jgi:hypothetical protein
MAPDGTRRTPTDREEFEMSDDDWGEEAVGDLALQELVGRYAAAQAAERRRRERDESDEYDFGDEGPSAD